MPAGGFVDQGRAGAGGDAGAERMVCTARTAPPVAWEPTHGSRRNGWDWFAWMAMQCAILEGGWVATVLHLDGVAPELDVPMEDVD